MRQFIRETFCVCFAYSAYPVLCALYGRHAARQRVRESIDAALGVEPPASAFPWVR